MEKQNKFFKNQNTINNADKNRIRNYILNLVGLDTNDNTNTNEYKNEILREKQKNLKDLRFQKLYLNKVYSKDKNSKDFTNLKNFNNDYIDNIFKSNFVFQYKCNIF